MMQKGSYLMTLMEQLTADMKEAMKQGEKERLSVIRLVRGAVRQVEIDGKKTLTDDEVLGVIGKEVKMRRDSIEEFERGGRADLVEKTQAEIAVLMPYLPEQLSADEIKKIVEEVISSVGASSSKDMGKVMGALMPRVKGRADGKLVNETVRALLQ
ncbi:YqeY-like protein [Selenomonas artemidis F0399]|jgi:gatB/yqey domain protein|uniref:YqeY-like protein n=2 Tax=Selenomonas TaxID=970 RepID=E7N006_9FIRM|nr:YqeY-like protein [Selenomonas artemidis F0399]